MQRVGFEEFKSKFKLGLKSSSSSSSWVSREQVFFVESIKAVSQTSF